MSNKDNQSIEDIVATFHDACARPQWKDVIEKLGQKKGDVFAELEYALMTGGDNAANDVMDKYRCSAITAPNRDGKSLMYHACRGGDYYGHSDYPVVLFDYLNRRYPNALHVRGPQDESMVNVWMAGPKNHIAILQKLVSKNVVLDQGNTGHRIMEYIYGEQAEQYRQSYPERVEHIKQLLNFAENNAGIPTPLKPINTVYLKKSALSKTTDEWQNNDGLWAKGLTIGAKNKLSPIFKDKTRLGAIRELFMRDDPMPIAELASMMGRPNISSDLQHFRIMGVIECKRGSTTYGLPAKLRTILEEKRSGANSPELSDLMILQGISKFLTEKEMGGRAGGI